MTQTGGGVGLEEELEVVVVLGEGDGVRGGGLGALGKVHVAILDEHLFDLHERLGAILKEVIHLAAVDADDAEHELAGETERQGGVRVDDGLCEKTEGGAGRKVSEVSEEGRGTGRRRRRRRAAATNGCQKTRRGEKIVVAGPSGRAGRARARRGRRTRGAGRARAKGSRRSVERDAGLARRARMGTRGIFWHPRGRVGTRGRDTHEQPARRPSR